MKAPLVSVVMPVYESNSAHLRESIESILSQTFKDFELIVVNDGSGRWIKDVIEGYEDPRIRYHYQKNRGFSGAVNTGIALAKGEYIAAQNDDDVSLPGRLEKQVKVLKTHPEVEMVYSLVDFVDANGKKFWQWGALDGPKTHPDALKQYFTNMSAVPYPSIMFRRRHIKGREVFSEDFMLASDLLHTFDVLFEFDIYQIDEPLVMMRRCGEDLTTLNRAVGFREEGMVLERVWERAQATGLLSESDYRKAYSNKYIGEFAFWSIRDKRRAFPIWLKALRHYPLNLRVYKHIIRFFLPTYDQRKRFRKAFGALKTTATTK